MPGVLRLGQYLVLHLLTLLLPHPQFLISSSCLELGLGSGRDSPFLTWSLLLELSVPLWRDILARR